MSLTSPRSCLRAQGPRPPARSNVVVSIVVGLVVAIANPSRAHASEARDRPLTIRVEGNRLVDDAGAAVRLVGVNHSGAEYLCVHGHGIFASPADARVAAAIASWHANVVRVALNESCWLGARHIPRSTSGPAYRDRIASFVRALHAAGLYAIVELHWSAPGDAEAIGQRPMPDADRSLAFWRSVATTFADDHAMLFDVFNEPFVDSAVRNETDAWQCWRDGCTVFDDRHQHGWRAAGMQQLVDAIRSTGARQPILLGGLAWAHDLSGWISHMPDDPLHALVASFHTYAGETCADVSCWDARLLPVARIVPVIASEIGESERGHAYIDRFMAWADAHDVSYLAWTWNTWRGSPFSLVADWSGRPASAYGRAFREHLARAGASSCRQKETGRTFSGGAGL